MIVGILISILTMGNFEEVAPFTGSSFRVHPAGFYYDSLPPDCYRASGNQLSMVLDENPVNDDDLPYSLVRQYLPSLTVDGNGNYIAAWCDRRCGTDDNETYVRAFDYLGTPLRPDYCPNTYEGYRCHRCPNVAADAQGNHVVIWSEYKGIGANAIARMLGPSGNPLSGPFRVNDEEGTVEYFEARISVDMNRKGEFVVAWATPDIRGLCDVYLQIYDVYAQPVGGNIKVNTAGGGNYLPSVCVDENRNIVIVWDYKVTIGSPPILYAQRFDANGNPLGVNFVVDNASDVSAFGTVDSKPDGEFTVTWGATTGGTDNEIWCKMYHAEGTEIRTFMVNDANETWDRWPDLSVDAAGNFVIAWYYEDAVTGDHYVHLQRYDSQGLRIGGNTRANEFPLGWAGNRWPSVTLGDGGYFMVAWEDYILRPLGTGHGCCVEV